MNSPTTPLKKRVRDISNLPQSYLASPTKRIRLQVATPPPSPVKNANPTVGHQLEKLRALFHRGSTILAPQNGALIGRKTEADQIISFIQKAIASPKAPSSMHISGPPGTGKTAQVNSVIDFLDSGSRSTVYVRVNCMALVHPQHIFAEIAKKAKIPYSSHPMLLDLALVMNHKAIVVVLDEIDSLVNRHQQILFDLFKLTMPRTDDGCRLILLGIANALDLTDKFLPQLLQYAVSPTHLVFQPYSSDQIKKVLEARIASIASINSQNLLVHALALDLCSRKTAASTGDVRKAFDLMYLSIQVASSTKSPFVTISHVAMASLSMAGGSLGSNALCRLNLLQKAVMCCIFSYILHSPAMKRPTVDELYHHYVHHVQPQGGHMLGTLRHCEFLDIVSALESNGSIALGLALKKEYALALDMGRRLVSPNVAKQDLVASIGDIAVLSSMLAA